jgi:hypothetical protein
LCAAAVNAAVTEGRLKRRSFPFVLRVGGLNIVMTVEENRGRALFTLYFREENWNWMSRCFADRED